MEKIAASQKKEKSAAKAQLMREKREIEHMRLRYLAAEEKKVIASERKELEELKTELSRLVMLVWNIICIIIIIIMFLIFIPFPLE